jgi:hypothetical protein
MWNRACRGFVDPRAPRCETRRSDAAQDLDPRSVPGSDFLSRCRCGLQSDLAEGRCVPFRLRALSALVRPVAEAPIAHQDFRAYRRTFGRRWGSSRALVLVRCPPRVHVVLGLCAGFVCRRVFTCRLPRVPRVARRRGFLPHFRALVKSEWTAPSVRGGGRDISRSMLSHEPCGWRSGARTAGAE